MENCRRRQSSSVSVLLPTGDSGNGVTVQQESIPAESCEAEIPRITFTIRNTSLGPLVAQAFLPVFLGGWAVAIFQLLYSSRGRSVFIQCAPVKTGME